LSALGPQTITTDRLDRQLIHALIVDGRAPFSRLAAVLDSSEQTVARRYRRLREAGIVRVIVLRAPAGPGLDWFVRIQVRPGSAGRLAEALAQRSDVSWVSITSGGAEVLCVSRPSTSVQRDALLLERLPRTNQVTGLFAHAILHPFSDEADEEWSAFDDPLTTEQEQALRAGKPAGRLIPREATDAPSREDEPLLQALYADGRASYAALAATTGWSAARAGRRLEQLRASGHLYVDVEVATESLGFATLAAVWLTVTPSELQTVGHRVARLDQTAYAAAVTGPSNLVASVACRDSEELYRYLTHDIGALDGVTSAEVTPVIRRIKQAGTIMEGPRLALML
jgi:DNA-binding Lrp family transcriptional regulator